MGGFRIGRILGFEINIDWSWLFIFFLVVYSLASGYFPRFYPQLDVTTNWLMGVAAALLLFASVLFHELAHSVVSRSHGNEVMGITLFLFGGMAQTTDEPRRAREEFWMALAGPASSFVLALVFYALGGLGRMAGWPVWLIAILGYLAFINLVLGGFNLLPGYPLDGGRVLRSIIWGVTKDVEKATRYASHMGQLFGYVFMGIGFMNFLSGSLVGGLWMIFVGWFLTGAARTSYQQLQIRQALSGVRVDQVMTTDVPVIPASMSVREFVDENLLRRDYACYPVADHDKPVGVIGAEEVRTLPSEQWGTSQVGQIAHLADDEALKITGDEDAWQALSKLAGGNMCRLIVVEGDSIQGTVGREALFRLVQTKMQLGL